MTIATFDVTLFSLRSDAERFAFAVRKMQERRREGEEFRCPRGNLGSLEESRGASGSRRPLVISISFYSANVNVERPFAVARVSRLASRVLRLASRVSRKDSVDRFRGRKRKLAGDRSANKSTANNAANAVLSCPPFFLPCFPFSAFSLLPSYLADCGKISDKKAIRTARERERERERERRVAEKCSLALSLREAILNASAALDRSCLTETSLLSDRFCAFFRVFFPNLFVSDLARRGETTPAR